VVVPPPLDPLLIEEGKFLTKLPSWLRRGRGWSGPRVDFSSSPTRRPKKARASARIFQNDAVRCILTRDRDSDMEMGCI
jgi:hypothetical protein